MATILFDIGGTKMRVAKKLSSDTFSEPIVRKTPGGVEAGLREFSECVREAAEGEDIELIIGGIAAVFENETIVNSANLKGWIGMNLPEKIREATGAAQCIVQNDAAIVGLGEAVHGGGRGGRIVVYMTVSTGIGGARITEGSIDESAFGFEPGHQIINIETSETLEDLASGGGFRKRFDREPFEVPQEDDTWNEAAKNLAVGIHNTILHWSPDTLVLGGPMIVGDPAIPFEAITDELQNTMTIFKTLPDIRRAELESFGGLYGALALSEK